MLTFDEAKKTIPKEGDILELADGHSRAFLITTLDQETAKLRCRVNAQIHLREDDSAYWAISSELKGLSCYLTDASVGLLVGKNKFRIDDLYVTRLKVLKVVDTGQPMRLGNATRKYLVCEVI